jgi:hypothetical protein
MNKTRRLKSRKRIRNRIINQTTTRIKKRTTTRIQTKRLKQNPAKKHGLTKKTRKYRGGKLFNTPLSDPRFGVGYSKNQYELMNQFIPFKEELTTNDHFLLPFSMTFGRNFLGYDMKFFVPPDKKNIYKNYPTYNVDDYVLSYRGELDPTTNKKQPFPFMQNILNERDVTVSYYDAVSLIIQLPTWKVTFESKKPIQLSRPPKVVKSLEYEFKDCKYGAPPKKSLAILEEALLRCFGDFAREINMREMVYMKQGLQPFVITSSTTPLFSAYYKIGSTSSNPFGIDNNSGLESIEYIKSRFSIILVCFMLDDSVDQLKQFQKQINQRDATFVNKIQKIVNNKTRGFTDDKKKWNVFKQINNYICEINTYILSVCVNNSDRVVRQIDVYYSVIVAASWSSFNVLFQKEYMFYLYETMRNPQRIMEINPLYEPWRVPINIITAKDMEDTPESERDKKMNEMNSLLNLNPKIEKTVKDYVTGSNNTILYSKNSKGDFLLVNTSIERVNFAPDENNTSKQFLFFIVYTEKMFNFTQNTYQETAKFRFAMNAQNKKDILANFTTSAGHTLYDFFPYWDAIHPIDEIGLPLNESYNIPFVLYPTTGESIAATSAYASNAIKTPFKNAYARTTTVVNNAVRTPTGQKVLQTLKNGKAALVNHVIETKNCIFE